MFCHIALINVHYHLESHFSLNRMEYMIGPQYNLYYSEWESTILQYAGDILSIFLNIEVSFLLIDLNTNIFIIYLFP